jgi:Uma2 family endonuclease
MAMITEKSWGGATMAALLNRLGGVSPRRVLLQPTPGRATEKDVLAIHKREHRLCELIDGVLLEKTIGIDESICAAWIVYFLIDFNRSQRLGQVLGPNGFIRLFPNMILIPDASFISWQRFPKGALGAAADLAPDLVVEILSKGNTKREMDRKLHEFFKSGVRLVWYVDPKKRTARVYTSPKHSTLLVEDDFLDGGDVLPGFRLSLREWFDEAGRTGPPQS